MPLGHYYWFVYHYLLVRPSIPFCMSHTKAALLSDTFSRNETEVGGYGGYRKMRSQTSKKIGEATKGIYSCSKKSRNNPILGHSGVGIELHTDLYHLATFCLVWQGVVFGIYLF